MLHMITRSPFQCTSFQECLAVISDTDILLLLADGVYATQILDTLPIKHCCYVIHSDIQARGLKEFPGLHYIDYTDMVDLTEHHRPIITWS
jgi:tRNA 2-thiouridine synthesizing protein B